MPYSFSLVLFLLFCTKALSQKPVGNYVQDKLAIPSENLEIEIRENGDTVSVVNFVNMNTRQYDLRNIRKVYKGTPFYANGWHKGLIYLGNSSPIEGTLAYDLTSDKVYYSKGSFADAIQIRPETFTIKDHTFRILKKEYKKAGSYYYEIILEGTYPLLKRTVCWKRTRLKNPEIIDPITEVMYEGYFEKEIKYYTAVNQRIYSLYTNSRKLPKKISGEYIDLKNEDSILRHFKKINK